jgi:hypothetical protein
LNWLQLSGNTGAMLRSKTVQVQTKALLESRNITPVQTWKRHENVKHFTRYDRKHQYIGED